jgi:hypothetical protein
VAKGEHVHIPKRERSMQKCWPTVNQFIIESARTVGEAL